MGNLAIVLMFIFLFVLIFIAPVLHAKDTFKKVEIFMLRLAKSLGLEFHKKTLKKKTQKIGYPDVSGEMDNRSVHVYVEDARTGEDEVHYVYIEMPCDNPLGRTFEICKRDKLSEVLKPVYGSNDVIEREDFVREKYTLVSEEDNFFAEFLSDEATCLALLGAEKLIRGTFELNYGQGMLTYRESTSTFDETQAERIEQLVRLTIQIAERVEAMG